MKFNKLKKEELRKGMENNSKYEYTYRARDKQLNYDNEETEGKSSRNIQKHTSQPSISTKRVEIILPSIETIIQKNTHIGNTKSLEEIINKIRENPLITEFGMEKELLNIQSYVKNSKKYPELTRSSLEQHYTLTTTDTQYPYTRPAKMFRSLGIYIYIYIYIYCIIGKSRNESINRYKSPNLSKYVKKYKNPPIAHSVSVSPLKFYCDIPKYLDEKLLPEHKFHIKDEIYPRNIKLENSGVEMESATQTEEFTSSKFIRHHNVNKLPKDNLGIKAQDSNIYIYIYKHRLYDYK